MADSKSVQGKTAKKRNIADIMAKKKPVTKRVPIQMDGEIADQIEKMRQEHTAARDHDRVSNQSDTAPAIQKKIDAMIKKAVKSIEVFTFRSIGRFAYDEMVGQHPPSKDQKKDGADFNTDTFPPHLVSASCIDPEIPIEDALEIFSDPDWNGAELRSLFFGALDVNRELGDIPLSRSESEGTLNSLLNLVTQSNSESLIPSTSVGS